MITVTRRYRRGSTITVNQANDSKGKSSLYINDNIKSMPHIRVVDKLKGRRGREEWNEREKEVFEGTIERIEFERLWYFKE